MARFCGMCGSPLDPETGLCPRCHPTDAYKAPEQRAMAGGQGQSGQSAQQPARAQGIGAAGRPNRSAMQQGTASKMQHPAGHSAQQARQAQAAHAQPARQSVQQQTQPADQQARQSTGAQSLHQPVQARRQKKRSGNKVLPILIGIVALVMLVALTTVLCWKRGVFQGLGLTPSVESGADAGTASDTAGGQDAQDGEITQGSDATGAAVATEAADGTGNATTTSTIELPLVSDAEYYAISYEGYDGVSEMFLLYHFPQINLPDGLTDAVNAEMNEELNAFVNPLDEDTGLPMVDDQYLESMDYQWTVSNGIISIVLAQHWFQYDPEGGNNLPTKYSAYNVSVETGKVVPREDMLTAYGMTRDTFVGDVQQALRDADRADDTVLSEDSIERTSQVYIGLDGQLCCIATRVDGFSDSGYGEGLFHLGIAAPADDTESDADETATTALTADQPIVTTAVRRQIDNDELWNGAWSYSYRVPEVHLDNDAAAAVNEVIYNDFNPYRDDAEGDGLPVIDGKSCSGIDYYWQQTGDLLTIMMVSQPVYEGSAGVLCKSYYINTTTGEQLTLQEALAAFDLVEGEYYLPARDALQDYIDKVWSAYIYEADYQEAVDRILSSDAIAQSQLYVNSQGDLCAALQMNPDGDTRYWKLLRICSLAD